MEEPVELLAPPDAIQLAPAFCVRLDYMKRDSYSFEPRCIDARVTWWAGDYGYIRGLDHDRDSDRTFRTDRISAWQVADAPCWLVPAKTLYSDLKQLAALDRGRVYRHRTGVCCSRPTTAEEGMSYAATTLDELAAMTLVVAYVARADKRVTKNEQAAIGAALGVWSRGLGVEPEGLLGEQVERAAFREAVLFLTGATREARRATLVGAFCVANATSGVNADEAATLIEVETAFRLGPGVAFEFSR